MIRKLSLLMLFILSVAVVLVPAWAFAQTGGEPYAARWRVVDSLIFQKNLPQSALKVVDDIYAQAGREKNDVQLIKALSYRCGLQQRTSEAGLPLAVAQIE